MDPYSEDDPKIKQLIKDLRYGGMRHVITEDQILYGVGRQRVKEYEKTKKKYRKLQRRY